MKLLFCPKCSTVTNLKLSKDWTRCECGTTQARYIDPVNAEWNGKGFLIGFANNSFLEALENQLEYGDKPDGMGYTFKAFVIPNASPSIRAIEE